MSTPSLPSKSEPDHHSLTLLNFAQTRHERHEATFITDHHALLESIWENSSEPMRVTDSKGIIVAANDAYCRMVGMEKEELVGEPFTVVFDDSEDRSRLLRKFCKRFKERDIERVMNREVCLNNQKTIFFETSNSFITGKDGQTYLLSIIHDISERRAAEKALEASERKLHEFVDNAVQGFFQSTMSGTLLSANPSLIRMLGYESLEELRSINLEALYVDPDARKTLTMMLSEKGSCSNVELELRRKDGTVISVQEHSRAVVDSNGSVIALEGMIEDVSERKMAEDALRLERNLLRTLIDNLPDFIYVKDAEGRYLLNNQAHLRSIGARGQDSVLGKTSYDFHPNELGRKYEQDERAIVETGKPLYNREEPALHKDSGVVRWHLTSKIPLQDIEGKVTAVVGISRDITERKELEQRLRENFAALQTSREQLERLNEQKDRLMSVLSHDLRSPFTSILGFCDILLEDAETLTSSERTQFTTFIRDSARRQLTLLNQLLDWSRLETGRVSFDMKEVDLKAIAAECVEGHLGLAMRKAIILRSTLQRRMTVRGDVSMLGQVFNNLISNALKFTPLGGSITVDQTEGAEQEWVVRVSDSGIGIPKKDLKRLFKVEEKYTRRGIQGEEGTGLGLSVVDEIVRKHSGSITVESEEGHGTTFTIRLPRLVKPEDQNVLVVDDDLGVRVLHSRYLKPMFPDAQIILASNGTEALEEAGRSLPRLIVTDYSMPGMNGFELLNRLKQNEATKNIPVLVVTGKDSSDGAESLLLSGAAAVLTKPVSAREMQEKIEEILKEKI